MSARCSMHTRTTVTVTVTITVASTTVTNCGNKTSQIQTIKKSDCLKGSTRSICSYRLYQLYSPSVTKNTFKMATYYSSYILDLVTIFNVSGSGPNPAGSKITGSGWDPDPKILGPVHPIILFFFCQIISLLLTQVYILPPKLKQSQYF